MDLFLNDVSYDFTHRDCHAAKRLDCDVVSRNHVIPKICANKTAWSPKYVQTKPRDPQTMCKRNHITLKDCEPNHITPIALQNKTTSLDTNHPPNRNIQPIPKSHGNQIVVPKYRKRVTFKFTYTPHTCIHYITLHYVALHCIALSYITIYYIIFRNYITLHH